MDALIKWARGHYYHPTTKNMIDEAEAELAALKSLVREMASALKFATYGSPGGIEKRSQEILNRPKVKAILSPPFTGPSAASPSPQ